MKGIIMNKKSINKDDIVFDCINNVIMIIILLIVLYPLYFILIASVSDPDAVSLGKVVLLPKTIDFAGYLRVFHSKRIWLGYYNTIIYTVFGTILSVFLTITAAYPLSQKKLSIKKPLMIFFTIPMFFSGGIVATYLVVKSLGMVNTPSAILVLGSVTMWNIVIARTFIQTTIPAEISEAAEVDGCSNFRYFFQILLPLSKAIIAVEALFYGVGHWNDFFKALIYINSQQLKPLQLILSELLSSLEVSNEMQQLVDNVYDINEMSKIAGLMKYCIIVVASAPLLAVYPFLQKYFVQGVMIGSLKG